MLGAIIGDIVGSVYEFNPHKSKNFPFWDSAGSFTDDSVMTIAVGNVCRTLMDGEVPLTQESLWVDAFGREMHRMGKCYPGRGYGGRFIQWLESDTPQPYNSMGNGSAMRVSPISLCTKTLDDCLKTARLSAEPTHNHPEGILGAQAAAAAGWLARHGYSKNGIRRFVETNFYPLDFTLDSIRDSYRFSAICRDSVPQAIVAFLEADGFEDAIRNAISIGGDSDTIAAIAGGIAEAFYGIPAALKEAALSYLPPELKNHIDNFYSFIEKNV